MYFGFMNENIEYESLHFIIKPLVEENRLEEIKKYFYIKDGWIYPPLEADKEGIEYKAISCYRVLISHEIIAKNENNNKNTELMEFMICVIGFFKGLQLRPQNWVHFNKTPIEEGELVGVSMTKKSFEKSIDKALEIYINDQNGNISKLYYAVLHWFLHSKTYIRDFEKFGIETPEWAICKEGKSYISKIRNEMVHEGLFFGVPIGFASEEKDRRLILELEH